MTRGIWSLGAICVTTLLAVTTPVIADKLSNVVTGGHTEVQAVVDKIESEMIFMKVPGQLQPRTLPVAKAQRMGLGNLKEGDPVTLVVDENNVVIDAHRAGTRKGEVGHRILEGKLQDAESAGKKIRLATTDGVQTFNVDPGAAGKIAGLKKGDVLKVELDETNKVIDIHTDK